jgi:alpha-tubulin suppressor-like RCC1 family protein
MTGNQKQWEEVSAGVEHTCAVDKGGQVYCWGNAGGGRCGDPTGTIGFATPAGADKVGLGSISAANTHTCARPFGSPGARCWGTEDKGALGNGVPTSETSSAAVPVNITTEVKQVAVGGGHSCALDAQGDGRCWGDNALGQLGLPLTTTFVDAPGSLKVGAVPLAYISAGGATTCGISVMNRVLACVGNNASGQLGRGGSKDTSAHPDPLPVLKPDGSGANFDGVAVVSVGRDHVCAIQSSALQVFCWGEGADGQVGDSFGGMPRTLPVAVAEPE